MDNLWTRRANTNKLSLSTASTGTNGTGTTTSDSGTRATSTFPKRFGNETPKRAGFGSLGGGLTTPSSAASTAFALGSGALSFGAGKTPRTPGANPNPFESSFGTKTPTAERPATSDDVATSAAVPPHKPASKAPSMASISETNATSEPPAPTHALKDAWSFWFRPPLPKGMGYVDYEKTLHGIATVSTAEDFFIVYAHLKRPSALPAVSDYHLFKRGVRPIWEDDENKKGGKWVVRMKKGVADRYWEDLLLALVGDQFGDWSDEVCGAVLSVRNGEDTLSIWLRTEGPHTLKIRDSMKHILSFPANTKIEWRSHDSSIQQRTAVGEQRREKAASSGHGHNGHSQGDQRYSRTTEGQRGGSEVARES